MKKCIIAGNGPSYNEIPAGVLESTPSFGVNYCDFQPDYYVCVDHEILTVHHAKVRHLVKGAKVAFLAGKEKGASPLCDLPNVQLVYKDTDAFSEEHYFSGLTVCYVALKIAYYSAFEEVHLYGIDHSPDWAHYRSDYPPGDVDRRAWRMSEMEYHYGLAAKVYKAAGRRIINHSRPSKLDQIFERQKGE